MLKKSQLVFSAVKDTAAGVAAVGSFFKEHFAGKPIPRADPPEPHDRKVILRGLQLVSHAKEKITLATGVLQGVRLSDDQVDSYRQQLAASVFELRTVMQAFEDLFVAHALRDYDKVRSLIPTIYDADEKAQRIGVQLFVGIKGFGDSVEANARKDIIDIAAETHALRMFKLRTWFALACVLYLACFIIALIIAFCRFIRKKEPSRIIIDSA